uniref:Ig-like domain-containing protein n=1 Tax=Oryzias latipes TaxID=8090 RepID=A0A3P9ME47_ORYLA
MLGLGGFGTWRDWALWVASWPDTIFTYQDQLKENEGKSVTMKCNYQTSSNYVLLYWYKHDSDLQAPQFILWKGAKSSTREFIPDKRYESRTTDTSTELIIRKLTLADTALYYSLHMKQTKDNHTKMGPLHHPPPSQPTHPHPTSMSYITRGDTPAWEAWPTVAERDAILVRSTAPK